MRKALTLAAAVVVMHVASEASAQEAFGSKGQVSLNSSSTSLAGHIGLDPAVLTPFVAFGRTELPGRTVETPNEITETTNKRTIFLINPGIDFFVIDHLSIGGEVLFATGSSKDETKVTDKRTNSSLTRTDDGPSSTTFGIMPRIGYNILINRSFSIWPRGGFGFAHTGFSQDVAGRTIDASEKSWLLFADVMFNWHPSDKFFLGIGPGFSHSLARSSTTQTPTGDVTVDRPSITNFRFLGFAIGGVLN